MKPHLREVSSKLLHSCSRPEQACLKEIFILMKICPLRAVCTLCIDGIRSKRLWICRAFSAPVPRQNQYLHLFGSLVCPHMCLLLVVTLTLPEFFDVFEISSINGYSPFLLRIQLFSTFNLRL